MTILMKIFLIITLIGYCYNSEECGIQNCSFCYDNICEECDAGFFLVKDGSACVDNANCPTGTVPIILAEQQDICSCDASCFTCSGTSANCTDCESAYLYENKCHAQCPPGSFDPNPDTTESTGWTCIICDDICITCAQSATQCTSCAEDNLFALDYQCVSASVCEQNKKYGDNTTKVCTVCQHPCETCTGEASKCTSCAINHYLENNACVESCSDSHYFEDKLTNPDNYTCNPCDDNCAECQNTSIQCTLCPSADETYLQDSSKACVSNCEPGTFKNQSDTSNRLCSNCQSPCSECSDSESTCTKCTEASNLFLLGNSCVDPCNEGQFRNSTTMDNKICSDCINNCATCDTATYCIKCSTLDEYYLTPSNTCELDCPAGTFKNGSTADNKLCSPCLSPCSNCSGSEETCLTCITDYYFYEPNNTCLEFCPVGTFLTDIQCQDCNRDTSYCQECSGANTNCTKCTESSNTYLDSNLCVTLDKCSDGTYPDSNITDNKQCLSCPENCSLCKDFTECTECTVESLYLLYQGDCLEKCPSGTYPDTVTQKCIDCNSPCKECSKSSDNCTECTTESNQYLKNNLCEDQCGIGYYIDKTVSYKLCTICVAPCVECTSDIYCTRCNSELEQYLYQNACTDTCPLKTFKNSQDNTKKQCSACKINCADCTSLDYCLECTESSGLYLWDNTCVDGCPIGTYLDTSYSYFACKKCVEPCIVCNNASYCTQCLNESNTYLNLVEHTCVSECPTKTFKDTYNIADPKCSNCYTDCAECEGSQYNCLKCVLSLYLYAGTCYKAQECPSTTFANLTTADNGLCSVCNSPCSECSSNADSCTKCIEATNTYLIASQFKCVSFDQCPIGTYSDKIDASNKQCIQCTLPCSECYGLGTYCTKCSVDSNTYLYNNQCLTESECPIGTFANNTDTLKKTCSDCSYPCTKCTATECQGCDIQSGSKLINGQCLYECPIGQVIQTLDGIHSCVNCEEPCSECYGEPTVCTRCSETSGLYLLGSMCVEDIACPADHYADNQDLTNKICQPIDPVNTIYSYKTIAVAAMIAFVIFVYTTMIKI